MGCHGEIWEIPGHGKGTLADECGVIDGTAVVLDHRQPRGAR